MNRQDLIDEALRIVNGETMMMPTRAHLRALVAQNQELQAEIGRLVCEELEAEARYQEGQLTNERCN